MTKVLYWIAAGLLIGVVGGGSGTVWAQQRWTPPDGKGRQPSATLARTQAPAVTGQRVSCDEGSAGLYACSNVDLLAYLPITELGGARSANDIWGWTDPETNREYALIGLYEGTSFVDVTDPVNPVYLGMLPSHTQGSAWRDIKVYQNHAYIVADNAGPHGLQVFDLTQLRDVQDPPVTFAETAHYDKFGSSHNVAINEATGYAYAVGIQGQQAAPGCGPGLHIVDVRTPAAPAFAGCFNATNDGRVASGYTHDVQCVIYHGPDEEHQGKEICVLSNEDVIVVVDATDKQQVQELSKAGYPYFGYVHQGWFTEDHRYFFQDDELDEPGNVDSTRTIIWDLSDLDDPVVAREFFNATTTRDHNLYVRGDRVYQANYTGGLRILDVSDPVHPVEVAFFDTTPDDDRAVFEGAWSVYPYFESGTVVVSSIGEGLFVLKPVSTAAPEPGPGAPSDFALTAAYPNPFSRTTTLTLTLDEAQAVTLAVYDALGREVARLHDGPLAAGATPFTFDAPADLPSGTYMVRATGERTTKTRTITLLK